MPNPTVLRELLEQYESLQAEAAAGDDEVSRRLEDLAYTLCVSTGTRDVSDALAAARRQLADAHSGKHAA